MWALPAQPGRVSVRCRIKWVTSAFACQLSLCMQLRPPPASPSNQHVGAPYKPGRVDISCLPVQILCKGHCLLRIGALLWRSLKIWRRRLQRTLGPLPPCSHIRVITVHAPPSLMFPANGCCVHIMTLRASACLCRSILPGNPAHFPAVLSAAAMHDTSTLVKHAMAAVSSTTCRVAGGADGRAEVDERVPVAVWVQTQHIDVVP